ncbi:MAG TPA: prolyl oligopeptidase family serine peptidase [Isosphaeraceae bacterium]|jgi:dienelactone hydrolase/DNA-directed RNA polymerase subunit RPC12/RpoP|nr:prolyl oligopeptidase family serine peptidase [Isosphaeraceae bacterium]
MPILFRCGACGAMARAVDELAGRKVRCGRCGQKLLIPPRDDDPVEDDGEESPDDFGEDEDPVEDDGRFAPPPAVRPTWAGPAPGARRAPVGWIVAGIAVGMAVNVALIALVVRGLSGGAEAKDEAVARQAPGRPTAEGREDFAPSEVAAGLPDFPPPGPGVELEPGVRFHEIRLNGSGAPGHSGKFWLYLPAGEHPSRSLPCVLITAAGTNLLTGMSLFDSDRPEHLPYVRAGFAVLAFELDGPIGDLKTATMPQLAASFRKFQAAEAGLVNARLALGYLSARVPQVDPDRLFAAGHSSAATMALLFASREPRLKGCIAFAPAIDMEAKYGAELFQIDAAIPGVRDFVARYSPRNNESTLGCPVLFFCAEDDPVTPVADCREAVARLEAMGKPATLLTVPDGGHYRPMVETGIPRAIAWINDRLADLGPSAR